MSMHPDLLFSYHGYLFCSEDSLDWLCHRLKQIRSDVGCEEDKRIHFKELRSGCSGSTRTKTAVGWAKFFVNDMYGKAWFNLLGINLQNVDYDFFGPPADGGARDYRIYNRFFEMGLYSACRFFFDQSTDLVEILDIFSEARSLTSSDPFLIHAADKIGRRRSNITMNCTKVTLVAGDIRKERDFPEYVDIINLVDVLIGGCSQVFDYSSRSKTGCEEVAKILVPICERFTTTPYNPKSRYFKKYSATFFPKKRITFTDIMRIGESPPPDQFYHCRQLMFCQHNQGRFPGL